MIIENATLKSVSDFCIEIAFNLKSHSKVAADATIFNMQQEVIIKAWLSVGEMSRV